ncbi:Rho GTPase-activating protein 10, partial [Stegodyphus mimosarum]
MTVSNLGICFGPTLLRPEEETVAAIMDIKFGNIVVEILIENYEKVFNSVPETDAIRRQPPPYVPPPQPARKDGHTSPPLGHLSQGRSSAIESFGRSSVQNISNFPHSICSPTYPVLYPNSPPDQKNRSGIMLYNPMWNNGLPVNSSSSESLASHSVPPPRPPLPEQKNYPYPSSWRSELGTHRASAINTSDFASQEYFPQDEVSSNNVCPPHSSSASCTGRKVRTLFACRGENEMELSFEPNEIIYNVTPSQEPGWIRGTLKGKTGLIPANYVTYLS